MAKLWCAITSHHFCGLLPYHKFLIFLKFPHTAVLQMKTACNLYLPPRSTSHHAVWSLLCLLFKSSCCTCTAYVYSIRTCLARYAWDFYFHKSQVKRRPAPTRTPMNDGRDPICTSMSLFPISSSASTIQPKVVLLPKQKYV